MSYGKSIVDGLQKTGWSLVNLEEHPLGCLQGVDLGPYTLMLLLGPKNKVGASYYQIFLRDSSGDFSDQPAVIGLHHKGRYPSYNWIEIISLSSCLGFGSEKTVVELSSLGLDQLLLRYLADLIPPGGHMMIEYDSPSQMDTARSLSLGVPPVATPLGYMMFLAGCGFGFKDWHFAEGGSEGPRKLQGYKPLSQKQARLKAKNMARELQDFLSTAPVAGSSEVEKAARDRALAALEHLRQLGGA